MFNRSHLFLTVISSLWGLPFTLPTAAAPPLLVFGPDQPPPCVLAANRPLEQDAARDLCRYLSRISGQQIAPSESAQPSPLTIHVGRDAFAQQHAPQIANLRSDGYLIHTINRDGSWHLILAGNLARSAQWAVERFLHDFCGVRWLFPDPRYGEVVPPRTTLTIPATLSQRYEPDYLSRSNCGMYYFSPPRKLLRGGPHGDGYGGHAIQHIFGGQHFKEHPEWYAQFDGKRQWWSYGNGWQICTTDPGTVRHTVEYIDSFFDKNPDTPVVSIGQNDGNGWCECPQCTQFVNSFTPSYSLTERWFHWVNLVAREVRTRHPGKWVEAMAYANTSTPPRFKLEPNVAITKTFVLESEFQQAEQWKKVCSSVNLYSYMYGASFLGFRHYPHAAQEFLKWGIDELGALAHVTECGGDWVFDGPKYYYLQALQWDVDADVDQIMDEFCAASYGAAAPPMRSFWDRLEEVYQRRKPGPYRGVHKDWLFYQWVSWANSSYVQPNDEFREYTQADVQFLQKCVSDAQRLAAQETSEVQWRLQRLIEAWIFQRTLLTSVIEFYPSSLKPTVENDQQQVQAATRVTRLAQLRTQRATALHQMRSHPHINPRISSPSFWSWATAVSLFSHEETLLDALCNAITGYRTATQGRDGAQTYWTTIPRSDSLFSHAQTQLALLATPAITNRLANGGFEKGTLEGWTVEKGTLTVSTAAARTGTYGVATSTPAPATLTQSVPVAPFDRYRLSASFQMTSTPPETAVPMEATIEFFDGAHQLYSPPMRIMARTLDPAAGWLGLRSTVSVPAHADSARIRLKHSFRGDTQWDDVRFEKLLAGPAVAQETLTDQFSGTQLDRAKWVRMPGQGGVKPPTIHNGWLTWGDDVHSVTTVARFNNLLDEKGAARYRLRFRARATGDETANRDATINLSVGNFRQPTTRLLWYLYFSSPSRPKPMLSVFDDQSGKRVFSSSWNMPHLENQGRDLWCTMYFDKRDVLVYAARQAYLETPATFVCRYQHELSNLSANGSAYLTLYKGSYQLAEISLSRATGPSP